MSGRVCFESCSRAASRSFGVLLWSLPSAFFPCGHEGSERRGGTRDGRRVWTAAAHLWEQLVAGGGRLDDRAVWAEMGQDPVPGCGPVGFDLAVSRRCLDAERERNVDRVLAPEKELDGARRGDAGGQDDLAALGRLEAKLRAGPSRFDARKVGPLALADGVDNVACGGCVSGRGRRWRAVAGGGRPSCFSLTGSGQPPVGRPRLVPRFSVSSMAGSFREVWFWPLFRRRRPSLGLAIPTGG